MGDVYRELNTFALALQELDVDAAKGVVAKIRTDKKLQKEFKDKAFMSLGAKPLKTYLTSDIFIPVLKPDLLLNPDLRRPSTFIEFLIEVGTDVMTMDPADRYTINRRYSPERVDCDAGKATVVIFTILNLILPSLVDLSHRTIGWTGSPEHRETQEAILRSFRSMQDEKKRTVTPESTSARVKVGAAGVLSVLSSGDSSPASLRSRAGFSSSDSSPEVPAPAPLVIPGVRPCMRRLNFGDKPLLSATVSATVSASLYSLPFAAASSSSENSLREPLLKGFDGSVMDFSGSY
jgi:hypothetical protein